MNINLKFENYSLDRLPSIYPSNPQKEEDVGVFVNGALELNCIELLVKKINACVGLVLVDGGTNSFHKLLQECQKQKIKIESPPLCIVGDLDSVQDDVLNEMTKLFPKIEIIKFNRAKDFTDLEAALKLIQIDQIAHVTIFNALGGRVDQTLGNILYLFRDTYTRKVNIFGNIGELLSITTPDNKNSLNIVNQSTFVPIPNFTHEKLLITHNSNTQPRNLPSEGTLEYIFHKPGNIVQDLQTIRQCMAFPGIFKVKTEFEEIFAIAPDNKTISFNVKIGQTISLIPLEGAVSEIYTDGLHWNLTDGTLDVDFIGLSNIAISDKVSILVKKNTLLCVVNNFVDDDMLSIITVKK